MIRSSSIGAITQSRRERLPSFRMHAVAAEGDVFVVLSAEINGGRGGFSSDGKGSFRQKLMDADGSPRSLIGSGIWL